MDANKRFPHLPLRGVAKTERYITPRTGRGPSFNAPPRDRKKHGESLLDLLRKGNADALAKQQAGTAEQPSHGIVLWFRGKPGFDLAVKSLDVQKQGIEVLNVRKTDTGMVLATVFIPYGRVDYFTKRIRKYLDEDVKGSTKPKNAKLVEGIEDIQAAVFESFWTDDGVPIPAAGKEVWWELWLRTGKDPKEAENRFRSEAARLAIRLGARSVTFPDRVVLLAFTTREKLTASMEVLDLFAEVRLAKECPTAYLDLAPREQAEWALDTKSRIQRIDDETVSVCLLDTGVSRGHPLLVDSLAEEHVLTCFGNHPAADHDGHGSQMAGLALYGDLVEVVAGTLPVVLNHCLESVKILPPVGQNHPDLYGPITLEAVSRIEVESPNRKRVFSMAVTATDDRDRGQPSSWSAEIDQITAGNAGADQRLMFVSAGNTNPQERHNCPASNQTDGIHDPGQSWNAVTVGAYTERIIVQQPSFAGWNPVAQHGALAPSSTTSAIWQDKWPVKPDFVMEGGNEALDPLTLRSHCIEDLSLLTTSRTESGRMFAATGDTSAAVSLAARMAAIIWARYPHYRPETVRGLMVHSAEWTAAMTAGFGNNLKDRMNRLRNFGYGVPRLDTALECARNLLTLVAEEDLQPFDIKDNKTVGTRDMHFFTLPWPVDELRRLGEANVTMKVTLSYYVLPSPGRRGWENQHRYASHGLRFDVKRPEESIKEFRSRLNKLARGEEENVTGGSGSDGREWLIGSRLRARGSVHSDSWSGTASQLADSGCIGVFPVIGWWRERKQLERWRERVRYSMIVSIRTENVEADLYTPVETMLSVPVTIS